MWEIAPRDAAKLALAFDRLLDVELVERVPVACGTWHYKLTPAGLEAAAADAPPKIRGERDEDAPVSGPKLAKARANKLKKRKC